MTWIVDNRPELRFEVNFEDDPLQPHPAYLESLSPLGWWRLNELTGTNANDQGSANLDGTYGGGYTLGAEGVWQDTYNDRNTSTLFNGTTGWVQTAASSTWQNLTAAWTIGAWIYPTAARTGLVTYSGVICCEGTTDVTFYMFYGENQFVPTSPSKINVGFETGGGHRQIHDTTSPPLNTWSFYVGTWDGTNLAIYRNGVSVATGAPGVADVAAAGTRRLYIGFQNSHTQGTTDYFPGRIQDAFVFNRVLNEEEIRQLYRYFTIAPVDEGNYVDLSDRLRPMSIRRGRSDPNSRVEAGNLTVPLDNQDGLLLPPPVVNLLANPSFESTRDEAAYLPFTVQGGTLSSFVFSLGYGTRCVAAVSTGASGSTMYLTSERDGLVGMRPGKTYTFSALLLVSSVFGPGAVNDINIEIVDEVAGSQQVTSNAVSFGGVDTIVRAEVTRTIRSDADAAYVRVAMEDADAGKYVFVDAVQLEEANAATAYCDGDQTDCSWAGEPHWSMSRRRRSAEAPRKIVPMRRCRLVATWDATDYDLFHGYVDRFAYTFPGMDTDSVVTLNVTDGTRILSNISMRDFTRSVERPGDRVRAILAWAGISVDDYDVDDTYITPQALDSVTVADDTTALSMIRAIEETERGVFFVSRDGLFTYQGSEFRTTEGAEQFLLIEGDEGVPYSDIAAIIDLAGVVNDTKIENVASSTVHEFAEAYSQQQYLTLSASESSLWDQNDVSYIYRGEPQPLADSIEVRPLRNPDVLWPIMLGLELGALGRIERVRDGATDLFAGYMQFLEGIEHNIAPGNWTMNLRTSPTPAAPTSASLWQTSITKPIVKTSHASATSASSPIAMPSTTYTAGRLYVIYAGLWATGGATPSLPTITATNTFVNLDNVSSTGIRHATWAVVATSTVTEAISFAFGTPPSAAHDIVVVEILEGFQATPIGDHPGTQTGGQTLGAVDVGTLTDARSIVLFGVLKAANVTPVTSGAVQIYNRGAGSVSYHVGYGYPNVDSIGFDWSGVANGWGGILIEIEAT